MELKDLTISEQDFTEYQKWFQKRNVVFQVAFWLVAVGGVLLIGLGLYAAMARGWDWSVGLPWMVLGSIASVYLPLLLHFRTRREYRSPKNAALYAKHTLVIDDSGVSVTTAHATGHNDWSAYVEVAETPHLFILMVGKRQGQVIPKAMLTAAQIQTLREMIRNNIPSSQLSLD